MREIVTTQTHLISDEGHDFLVKELMKPAEFVPVICNETGAHCKLKDFKVYKGRGNP
jgi:hypothetical protein